MRKILIMFVVAVITIDASRADTETVNWYVDNVLYDTTTCESGDDIILPTAPIKRGHTFNGWTSGLYDMSTINTSINGTAYYARNASNSCTYLSGSMTASAEIACSNENFVDLSSSSRWKTIFSYGTVYGESMCSDAQGTKMGERVNGNPTTSGELRFCWCRITKFIPTDSDIVFYPMVTSWTYNIARSSSNGCGRYCSDECAKRVYNTQVLRTGLFGL